MKVQIHKDQFTSIRPWQWWIEDDKGVINWGGREWTAEDAQRAAQNALGKNELVAAIESALDKLTAELSSVQVPHFPTCACRYQFETNANAQRQAHR